MKMKLHLIDSDVLYTDAHISGADPGFQVRGGALKKIAPSGGRRENVGGI
jgi:hypothetical protein